MPTHYHHTTQDTCEQGPFYRVCLKLGNGRLFALPIVGNKQTIWDKLARHVGFRSYRVWKDTTQHEHKRRFQLVQIK